MSEVVLDTDCKIIRVIVELPSVMALISVLGRYQLENSYHWELNTSFARKPESRRGVWFDFAVQIDFDDDEAMNEIVALCRETESLNGHASMYQFSDEDPPYAIAGWTCLDYSGRPNA